MSIDQPVSMKATLTMATSATETMTVECEFVVQTEEEAEVRGEQYSRLILAFAKGYGSSASD